MSVQFIASRRPGKPVTWYVYAFRGGPLILKHVGPRKPRLGPSEHAAVSAALADQTRIDPRSTRAVLRAWCPIDPARDAEEAAPEWRALSDNTKRVWRPHVDKIEEKWGKFPLSVFDDPRMVEKVMKWRNEREATPRTADMGVTVLQHFLEYARLNGRIRVNIAKGVPSLYRGADRADIVWTKEDMDLFALKAEAERKSHVTDGLRLAAVTGLRREDLVTLTWAQVGEFAIVKKALKISRRRRRRVVIPQTPQLEALLAELRTRPRKAGVETVLVNSKGTSWTANSFGGSFSRMKQLADIHHVDEEGARREKHLHDVRGTFCTMLLTTWGLTDQEAAEIMGWSPERVASIRRVYVDHARVVVELGRRIAERQLKSS
ncbi:tyrosine-type recombinase/integrase [Sphingomonas yunnanensis]|nr:tyrosine-type recombinase/integrase [Sphingomonas yunnanensis]